MWVTSLAEKPMLESARITPVASSQSPVTDSVIAFLKNVPPFQFLSASELAKLAGRLRAELTFTPLEEIMSGLHEFLETIVRQCGQINTAVYQVYITYPIEAALQA